MTRKLHSLAELQSMVGTEVGVSEWFLIDQARIDAFAKATEDFQFIHIDPVAAAKTPFGSTIAHGYLSLSLTAAMSYQAMPGLEGTKMGVNYGLNKVRFISPVKSGSNVRGRFKLVDVTVRKDGAIQVTSEITIEIEGSEKPAMLAEWVTLTYV